MDANRGVNRPGAPTAAAARSRAERGAGSTHGGAQTEETAPPARCPLRPRLLQYLFNVPEGLARLSLEHRVRPGLALKAAFATDVSPAGLVGAVAAAGRPAWAHAATASCFTSIVFACRVAWGACCYACSRMGMATSSFWGHQVSQHPNAPCTHNTAPTPAAAAPPSSRPHPAPPRSQCRRITPAQHASVRCRHSRPLGRAAPLRTRALPHRERVPGRAPGARSRACRRPPHLLLR
jgi:hypothetical protein